MESENEKEPLNRRAKWIAKIKEACPDMDISDDDDSLFSALDEYSGKRDKKLSEYKSNNEKFAELFEKEPSFSGLLEDIISGIPVISAITKNFGDAFADGLQNDEEFKSQYNKGLKEYNETGTLYKEIKKAREENVAKYEQEVENYLDENSFSNEQKAEFINYANNLADKIIRIEFDREVCEAIRRAMNYDKDVSDAEELGEVKGANKKITLEKKTLSTDGTPDIGNKSNGSEGETKNPFGFSIRPSVWKDK